MSGSPWLFATWHQTMIVWVFGKNHSNLSIRSDFSSDKKTERLHKLLGCKNRSYSPWTCQTHSQTAISLTSFTQVLAHLADFNYSCKVNWNSGHLIAEQYYTLWWSILSNLHLTCKCSKDSQVKEDVEGGG